MNKKLFKPNTHFSHAYEAWTGERWQWSMNGKRNDPMDSDELTRAFYIGFNYAKKGQEPIKKIKHDLSSIKKDFKELENKIKRYER